MSSQPLLPGQIKAKETVRRHWLSTLLIPALLVAGVIWIAVKGEKRPKDDLGLANYYLTSSPVIDGHIDVPEYVRLRHRLNTSDIDLNDLEYHFSIPAARQGHLGGFFWSIYTACPAAGNDTDFVTPYFGARDALEQLDLAKRLIKQYPKDFAYCETADDVMAAIGSGKIASLFGLEGAHSLEASLGALRMMYELGVRYMTLTHSCNNAFADSAGIYVRPEPTWGGLSPLGVEAIKEMNRLGVIIDVSHTSDEAASQALDLTHAPVMLSHSCARGLNDIPRNAPDSLIDKVGKVGGVIMVNFYSGFAARDKMANIGTIADHVDYFGDRIGRKHVGIGSDFDGVDALPEGIENVSSYPYLFAELIRRGWKQDELAGLAGGNILRVLRGVEATAAKLRKQGKQPSQAIYEKRRDLHWGL